MAARHVVLLALSACTPATRVIEAPAVESANSVLLVAEDESSTSVIVAQNRGATEPWAELSRAGPLGVLTAMFVDLPLGGFEQLPVTLVQVGEMDPGWSISGRAVAIHRIDLGAGEETWRSIDAGSLPPALKELKFKIPAGRECMEIGGCMDGSVRCFVPCDATPPSDASLEVALPEAPAPPTAPSFLPCAPGWSSARVATATACAPRSEVSPACTGRELSFPSGCAALGGGCDGLAWPRSIVAADAVFVDASSSGGDGSQLAPFSTIEQALGALSVPSLIVLAPGDHVAPGRIDRDVTLLGTCPATTRILSGGTAVVVRNARVVVSQLSLEGALSADVAGPGAGLELDEVAANGTVWVDDQARADLRGVAVRIALSNRSGVVVRGATLSASRLAIQDADLGVEVTGNFAVTLRDTLIDGSGRHGIWAAAMGELRLEHVAITDSGGIGILVEPVATGPPALVAEGLFIARAGLEGILAVHGSRVTGRRLAIREVTGAGIHTYRGGDLSVEDLAVEGVGLDAGEEGHGFKAIDSANTIGERWSVRGTAEVGVLLLGRDGGGAIEDLEVTAASHDCLVVGDGWQLELERASLTSCGHLGVYVGSTSRLTLKDTVVRPAERGIMLYQDALLVPGSTQLNAERVLIERAKGFGVLVPGDCSASLYDLVVRGTRTNFEARAGESPKVEAAAVSTTLSAHFLLERGLIEDSEGVGLLFRGFPTDGNLQDITIRNMRPDVEGRDGTGVFVTTQAVASFARVRIEGVLGTAAAVHDLNSRLELRNLRIRGVSAAPGCGGCTRVDERSQDGVALESLGKSFLDVRDFIVEDTVFGVRVREEGSVDLRDGRLRAQSVAVEIWDPAFEAQRLSQSVELSSEGEILSRTPH